MSTTLVVGASPHPYRYAHLAIHKLVQAGEHVLAFGKHAGEVDGIPICTDPKLLEGSSVDTITLYLNPYNQKPLYEWMIGLRPRQVIFNPGTENPELEQRFREENITVIEACTLVMISTGSYQKLSRA